jgi:hypothetical protein
MQSAGVMLVGGLLASCGGQTRIPPGAQQVRVTGTASEVVLDPPTVGAGDVYLVIEGRVLFMEHAAGWQGDQPGPMSDEQLARLSQNGDQELTGGTELYPGYAGNVYKLTLAAGKYAFLPGADGEDPAANLAARADLCRQDPVECAELPPLSMAVLEVRP